MRHKGDYERKRRTKVKIDSGASSHVFCDKSLFNPYSIQPTNTQGSIISASGTRHKIIAKARAGYIGDINYAPGLTTNMISAGQLADQTGKAILFTKEGCYLVPSELPTHSRRIGSRGPDLLYDMDEELLSKKAYLMGRDTRVSNS